LLRILHLSDDTLPGGIISWRIQKSAISALKHGHEVFFGGLKKSIAAKETFNKIYEINWTPRARWAFPYDWHCVKKQLDRVLHEVKPDIVHANNIFSAKMISEFDMPFVYEDPEYCSLYVRRQIESYNSNKYNTNNINTPRKMIRHLAMGFLNSNFLRLVLKWEKELVSSVPTITVSDKIAEELMELGNTNRVFVTPNYPLSEETKDIQPYFHDGLSSVYAGIDGQRKSQYGQLPHRNMDGFVDMFYKLNIGNLTMIGINNPIENKQSITRVRYLGMIPRREMYDVMNNHSIGLVPFKKHWSHKYISPNKAYDYAHAGLLVMCTSSLVTINNVLKENCITFDDYDDMASQLDYFKNNPEELYNKRLKIYRFARNNLVWEKHEKNIINAYRMC
jgi:glycosyltransferase involved in cell wall biosynthesis